MPCGVDRRRASSLALHLDWVFMEAYGVWGFGFRVLYTLISNAY